MPSIVLYNAGIVSSSDLWEIVLVGVIHKSLDFKRAVAGEAGIAHFSSGQAVHVGVDDLLFEFSGPIDYVQWDSQVFGGSLGASFVGSAA